ncbi:MAG: glycosyltransferase family 39 protein [Lachnospiraceae bacterium]|jgi:hypothetical protein|nr:glycosyltransferase family 39 protein [Lachnospiraceae bacterium]
MIESFFVLEMICLMLAAGICIAHAMNHTKLVRNKGDIYIQKPTIGQGINWKNISHKYDWVLVLGLLVLFAFSRIYRLGQVPFGMHCDEMGMAYDAWSLALDHVDRYRKKMPFYLINFGGGQSIMYAYMAGALMLFFDYSITLVRIPAVVMGFCTLVGGFFITKEITGSKKTAFITAFFITVCPWYIMSQRWGLDCFLMLGFITISMYFLILALKREKTIFYFLSGGCFGLTLYTYALAYVIVPLFLCLCFFYTGWTKKLLLKKWIIFAVPLFLLAAPLLVMIIINTFELPEIAATYFTIPRIPMYRGDDVNIRTFLHNFHIFITMVTYDKNPVLIYNALPPFGSLFYFSIPFLVYGLALCIMTVFKKENRKNFSLLAFPLFLFISVLFTNLFVNDTNLNKINPAFLSIAFFMAVAVENICKIYKKWIFFFLLLYLGSFWVFCNFYFKEYDKVYEQELFDDMEFTKVMEYYNEMYYREEDKIYLDDTGVLSADLQLLLLLRASTFQWERKEERIRNYSFAYPGEGENMEKWEEGIYIIKEDESSQLVNELENKGFHRFDGYLSYGFYKMD